MIPSQGDIIEVSFDPTMGHEPQKRRPALVVSCDAFNRMASLTAVAPITSTDNGYPLHVRLPPESDVWGCVCVEQTRTLDLHARRYELVGRIDEDSMADVLERLGAMYGI